MSIDFLDFAIAKPGFLDFGRSSDGENELTIEETLPPLTGSFSFFVGFRLFHFAAIPWQTTDHTLQSILSVSSAATLQPYASSVPWEDAPPVPHAPSVFWEAMETASQTVSVSWTLHAVSQQTDAMRWAEGQPIQPVASISWDTGLVYRLITAVRWMIG
jgi:hypothetical protein